MDKRHSKAQPEKARLDQKTQGTKRASNNAIGITLTASKYELIHRITS